MTGDAPAAGKAIRAFVALPLPDAIRAGVADTIRRLKPLLPDARFVREEGVHITLRFLGWTPAETLARLEEPLRAAAADCPPVEIVVRGLGVFAERGSPRVLWMGLDLPSSVRTLQEACERAAVDAGLAPETRAFHPHLTLARWRGRSRRPALPEVNLGCARVEHLVLYRSELRASGAVHTPLSVIPLGERKAAVR